MNLHDISNAINENVVTLSKNVRRIGNVCSMVDRMDNEEKKSEESPQPYTLHDKLALTNENLSILNYDLNKLIEFLESKILLPGEQLTPQPKAPKPNNY